MKPIHVALLALLALLLPAGLWLQRADTRAHPLERQLDALNDFTFVQSVLYRDLLSARAGMLRNYDPLVEELATLQATLNRLTLISGDDPSLADAIGRLDHLVRSQEPWVEQFKSDNALLQNSLAYFSVFSTSLGDSDSEMALGANALATAMLRLTLNTSPAALANVDTQLLSFSARLAANPAPAPEALLAHARLVRELLPKTEAVLAALFSLDRNAHVEDIRLLIMQRHHHSERRADKVRSLLYTTSFILIGCVLWMARKLRARSRILRRRAATEHALAEMSTRLINSKPSDIATFIEQGLAEIAACWHADRAYFVLAGPHARTYKWSRGTLSFPPDWPERAAELTDRFGSTNEEVLRMPGTLQTGLPEDLQDWLCAPGKGRSAITLLGLDFLAGKVADFAGETGLLRMALDAIANVAERDILERDRARLEAGLQQARRMETIGALASGIAHNFNNITGAILGFAETALSRPQMDPRTTSDLCEIQRAGERARNLVQQLLTFGRRSSMERSPTDLKSLVAESKALLQASLRDEIKIIVREPATAVNVVGEATQLQQVILNVCHNAAQAMELRGSLEIKLAVREIEQARRLDVGELSSGRYGVLSIRDSGPGIDAMTRQRIFEPFFTTRKGGNGLGLATVREIVLEHSGALQIHSQPEWGTQFDIWLPSAPTLQSAALDRPSVLAAPGHRRNHGRGETILVVEPDHDRLLRHEEVLAALGYEPVGFTDAEAGFAACNETPQRFDAALVCYYPECIHHAENGAEDIRGSSHIAASLRKLTACLPIILSTSAARELRAPALAGNNIVAIIGHPPTLGELASGLSRCLHSAP